jgi:hypothetical protein
MTDKREPVPRHPRPDRGSMTSAGKIMISLIRLPLAIRLVPVTPRALPLCLFESEPIHL